MRAMSAGVVRYAPMMTMWILVSSVCMVAEQKAPQTKETPHAGPIKQEQTSKQQGPAGANGVPNSSPAPPQPSKASATWSISGPSERLRIPDNGETQFTVSANDKPINGLNLVQSTLQDTSSLVQLGTNEIDLCAEDANKQCESTINVSANSIRQLKLKIKPDFQTPGVFTGELRFSVADQSETKSFKLTVYSRPSVGSAWGTVAIVLGLLTYFLTHIWLRLRLARDEALLPVYELRATINTLREKIEPVSSQTGYIFGGLDQALSTVETVLSSNQIKNYLPVALPKPGTPSDDWVSGFKAYLNPIRDHIAGLVVLTNSGVLQVAPYWSTNQAATKTAFTAIDGLAGLVNDANTAQVKLTPIIQTLFNTINQPAAQALAPFLAAAPAGLTRFFTAPPMSNRCEWIYIGALCGYGVFGC